MYCWFKFWLSYPKKKFGVFKQIEKKNQNLFELFSKTESCLSHKERISTLNLFEIKTLFFILNKTYYIKLIVQKDFTTFL